MNNIFENERNPIPAGVLEIRIRWGGGGQFDPPSKSHVWCPNMTNDTSLESSCALLLESAKNCKFAKKDFILQNPIIYAVKMKYKILKSPWPSHFEYAKFFAKVN